MSRPIPAVISREKQTVNSLTLHFQSLNSENISVIERSTANSNFTLQVLKTKELVLGIKYVTYV